MGDEEFAFAAMTSELLEQTCAEWLDKIPGHTVEELIPLAKSKLLMYANWFQHELDDNNPEEVSYYVLQRASNGEIVAIVQMTDATKGKDPSFKLLNLYFDPISNLEFIDKDSLTSDDIKRISIILTLAISKSAVYAFEHGNKFKMYLRTNEIATMFETILTLQNGEPDLYSVIRQGSWLVFELK